MKFLFLHLCLLLAIVAKGQFQLNGAAVNLGSGTYQMTPNSGNQTGAIWYQLQHDLNDPFNVQGRLYFGNQDSGADGIAFVMQNNCLVAGGGGGGLGYGGITGKSLAVEFDTYQNILGTGAEKNADPVYDHIGIQKNGVAKHDSAGFNLAGPVQMDAVKADIEDGLWYDFQISYNPSTTTLDVYFNGSLRTSLVVDIKNTIFSGNRFVYWGFTSSTGGFSNLQQVYINGALTSYTLSDTTISCSGSVPVNLPPLAARFQGTNVALSKTAVASSLENAGAPASHSVDANMGTRWASVWNVDPQWIYVDLGTFYDLDSVVLYWEGAYATQYKIQVSTDASAWTDVYTETAGNGGKDKIVFSAASKRYVRMYGTARALAPYGYSLWEFQVYGIPKYEWSPDNGTISPDLYSANITITPTATTTYTVKIPDPCLGSVSYNITVTVNCPLPVEFTNFTAVPDAKGVRLDWATASEINTSYFEILKSVDGINFYVIGYQNASNNSNSLISYNYHDDETVNGIVYYKIVAVDADGTKQESDVRSVQNKSQKVFISEPVFADETSLILSGIFGNLQYSIIDMLGREVYASSVQNPPAVIYIGQDLAPACYLVKVKNDSCLETFKICKVR
jgi:hypothetical protein